MGANTKIKWVRNSDGSPGHTFNPWIGCTRVSPGCDNCYAAAMSHRFGNDNLWNGDRRRTQTWGDPRRWNREAGEKGIRVRVFCASMADVFDNEVPPEWRDDLFALIRATPHLDWIFVTKRIGNAAKMLPADWGEGYPNVWLLITVVNEAEAARDCPKLRKIPAVVRGVSIEPMLGPVDFAEFPRRDLPADHWFTEIEYLDWVICGGESGPGARPMQADWARLLRDQCEGWGVAFFFKQWGPTKIAGCLLDGREHLELPK